MADLEAEWLLSERPRCFGVSQPKATYAIVMVLGGDSNLDSMMTMDVAEMVRGSSDLISVLLLIDAPGDTGSLFAEVTPEGFRVLEEHKEISTGDPRVLSAFFARALISYSRETRFALGFWGHGRGVFGDQDPGEILLPTAVMRQILPNWLEEHISLQKRLHSAAMLSDETSGDTLTNREARSALTVAFARAERQRPVDLIFSDTCLNGSVEVYTELREFAQAIVASSMLVAGEGWDYWKWLKLIAMTEPADAHQWAMTAVAAFKFTYSQGPGIEPRQLAAFATSSADLVSAFARIVEALLSMDPKQAGNFLYDAIFETKRRFIRYDANLDLQHLVGRLLAYADGDLAEACTSFLDAFEKSQISISPQPYDDFQLGGLTIWCPVDSNERGVSRYYEKLEFGQKTGWLQCLRTLYPDPRLLKLDE